MCPHGVNVNILNEGGQQLLEAGDASPELPQQRRASQEVLGGLDRSLVACHDGGDMPRHCYRKELTLPYVQRYALNDSRFLDRSCEGDFLIGGLKEI